MIAIELTYFLNALSELLPSESRDITVHYDEATKSIRIVAPPYNEVSVPTQELDGALTRADYCAALRDMALRVASSFEMGHPIIIPKTPVREP